MEAMTNPMKALCGAVAAAAVLLTLTACQCVCKKGSSDALELFNGKDLQGWNYVLEDPAVKRDSVWTVRDGIIICKGEPLGFLYSEKTVTNFRLLVEYRWAPGAKPGNSGIFSRIHPPLSALPACSECQLAHGSAGDILTLQGMKMNVDQPRFFAVKAHAKAGDISGVKKLENKENPAGEWNQVEILAQGSKYQVWVNGSLVNEANGIEVIAGPVGLQSEGGEIHFRRASLTPLP
jgi:hypothetical protein